MTTKANRDIIKNDLNNKSIIVMAIKFTNISINSLFEWIT